jgi:hypothetical protein
MATPAAGGKLSTAAKEGFTVLAEGEGQIAAE